ncbi:MAG TPA: hypothetical protein VFE92_03355, partial [Dermatophilaceae bacterium]|nr:hypothetical protein [Dermatophilaceae bacterium]
MATRGWTSRATSRDAHSPRCVHRDGRHFSLRRPGLEEALEVPRVDRRAVPGREDKARPVVFHFTVRT